jgi:hypothetical protein
MSDISTSLEDGNENRSELSRYGNDSHRVTPSPILIAPDPNAGSE